MGAVRLSVAVMAHPSRAEPAGRLIDALDGLPRLVLDPAPDEPPHTLRTAIEAWAAAGDGATHHLVLQDDVLPGRDFLPAVEAAAARFPDAALAFYAHWTSWNGALTRLAVRCGRAWCEMLSNEWAPTVALLLPAARAAEFVRFARGIQGIEAARLPDDHAIAAFVRRQRLAALIAAPNLVEHDHALDTVVGSEEGPHRSACVLPAGAPAGGCDGVLRLAEVAAIPYLHRGEAFAVTEQGPGRWVLSNWRVSGVDDDRLWYGYPEARADLTDAASEMLTPARERVVSSLWIAAYLDGWTARRLGGTPASPELTRCASERMARGGLDRSLPAAELERCAPALAGFAQRAVEAGARA